MPDYYSNPGTEEAGSDSPPANNQADSEDTETAEEQTALLPKTILGGKKFEVGDEVVLKIVSMYDDEVEVVYATGDEEETPNQPMQESSPDMNEAEGKLDSMASY